MDGVLVDDRNLYDGAGLLRHRSIYAAPCGDRACVWALSSPTSGINDRVPARANRGPQDLSSLFLPPDDTVTRTNPYGFWVLYDPENAVRGLAARDAEGNEVADQVQTGPPWSGTLHLLLARTDQTEKVLVTDSSGRVRVFDPEDLPGAR